MNHTAKLCYLPRVDATLLNKTLSGWLSSFPQMGVCAFLPEAQKDQFGLLQAQCARLQIPLVSGR